MCHHTLFMNEKLVSRVSMIICFENEYSLVPIETSKKFLIKNNYHESDVFYIDFNIPSLECLSQNIYSFIY